MAIYTYIRSFTPVPDLLHPPLSLYTHLRCSIFTLGLPNQCQYPLTNSSPVTPIPTHSHTSEALLTHQSLQYPYQIFHTHPSHPNKTLHTHIRPSLPIIGLHTITCPFKTTLGPPPQSQVLLPHPRPSYPTQTFHTTLCHPDQFQEPLHTHPNPFTPI